MRAVDDEPFEQDSRDLLLHHLRLGLREEVEKHAAEVVGVLVGVAELVRHRVEEKVPSLWVQFVRELKNKSCTERRRPAKAKTLANQR